MKGRERGKWKGRGSGGGKSCEHHRERSDAALEDKAELDRKRTTDGGIANETAHNSN